MVLGHRPTCSRDVQKRPRGCSPQMSDKKRCVENEPSRLSIEDCLPQDVLEAVIGFLDLETLCTARLVSKAFCAAASARVCNLTFTNRQQAVSLHRFPNVRDVTVEMYADADWGKGLAQLDPRLLERTTHVRIQPREWDFMYDTFEQIATMPRMRKLDVQDTLDEDAFLCCCTNLEAFIFHRCSIPVAMTVSTLTRLTSLNIGEVVKDEYYDDDGVKRVSFADVSWLTAVSNLTKLQALRIPVVSDGALPLVGNLTGLRGLTLFDPRTADGRYHSPPEDSIAPLTRLTRLRALDIAWLMMDSNLGIACSLVSGALVSLQLQSYRSDSDDFGRFLTHQRALTRLSVGDQRLSSLLHIPSTGIALLRCLEIYDDLCDAEGLAVLQRATCLTRLVYGTGAMEPQMGLSRALARLTQLCSLELNMYGDVYDDVEVGYDVKTLNFSVALTPLKALTKLSIFSRAFDDGDLRALLVLTGLRVLELDTPCLTKDVSRELGVLTNLNTFYEKHIWLATWYSRGPLGKVLDPLREARGLRPLCTLYSLENPLCDPRGTL